MNHLRPLLATSPSGMDLALRLSIRMATNAVMEPVEPQGAAGAALAFRYKDTRNVALCFFGDGATSRGEWHEGVNFAAVQKLPLVLICNNNQYAYSTPLNLQMACANVADRGSAYNMPAEIVDGNDVLKWTGSASSAKGAQGRRVHHQLR